MTDLEIMIMLEKEGIEPTLENAIIFKEEYLDENLKKIFNRAQDAVYELKSPHNRGVKSKIKNAGKALSGKLDRNVKWEVPEGVTDQYKEEVPNTTKLDKVNASVEYSDYELYQLLDESGYKPTERNLSILKEGLETGKYEILDEGIIRNAKENIKYNAELNKEAKKYSEEETNKRIYGLSDIDALKPGEDVDIRKAAREKRDNILSKKVPLRNIFKKDLKMTVNNYF